MKILSCRELKLKSDGSGTNSGACSISCALRVAASRCGRLSFARLFANQR